MSGEDTPRPLFTESGLAVLKSFVDRATLFAFDLDGTLAPLVADPQRIVVSEATRHELRILAARAPVAIITGRSRADAQAHLGISPRFLIGNHGAEGLPGWEKDEKRFARVCVDWQRQLESILPSGQTSPIHIENKGTTLSIHYRGARNRKEVQSVILRGIASLVPRPKRLAGRLAENLLPEGAPNKGTAMLRLLELTRSPKGFYTGDDATDEDVFRLDGDDLFTVRVGWRRTTGARYALRGQRNVVRLLREINRILGPP